MENEAPVHPSAVPPEEMGQDLEPEEWSRLLDRDEPRLVLDVRNSYEWDVGHFEGAARPDLRFFRDTELGALTHEAPTAAAVASGKEVKPSAGSGGAVVDQIGEIAATADGTDKDTPVFMYCTGGIRCEFYSTILKRKGFKTVYKLKGGIQHYGNVVGNKHWKGRLFVFDRRNTVPVGAGPAPVVGACLTCGAATETYRNCCNYSCNQLYITCDACYAGTKGCCSTACQVGVSSCNPNSVYLSR